MLPDGTVLVHAGGMMMQGRPQHVNPQFLVGARDRERERASQEDSSTGAYAEYSRSSRRGYDEQYPLNSCVYVHTAVYCVLGFLRKPAVSFSTQRARDFFFSDCGGVCVCVLCGFVCLAIFRVERCGFSLTEHSDESPSRVERHESRSHSSGRDKERESSTRRYLSYFLLHCQPDLSLSLCLFGYVRVSGCQSLCLF